MLYIFELILICSYCQSLELSKFSFKSTSLATHDFFSRWTLGFKKENLTFILYIWVIGKGEGSRTTQIGLVNQGKNQSQ